MRRATCVVALALAACDPGEETAVTPCGLHVAPARLAEAVHLEDLTVRVFKLSPDARLADVCRAAEGFRVQALPRVADPRAGHEGGTVSGDTSCDTGQIEIDVSTENGLALALPHELAHVAQHCDDASRDHVAWDTTVTPQLQQINACLDDERFAKSHPFGCFWNPGGKCATNCPL